jgi:HlyD family secretion protein
MKHKWMVAAAGAVVAAAGVLAFLQFSAPKVEVAKAARRDVVQTVVASGRVAAPNRVDIGSQVVGAVTEVPVAEGQSVRAGQTLIVLESSEARANEAQAKANLANAAAQLERNRRLQAQGFVGKSVLDDTERNFEVARTQLDAARAKLGYTTIRSPSTGTLIARDVERGDVVQPGKVLMVLSPHGETQLVLQIDERNLSRLKLGQRALASADAYAAQRFPAELVYINPGIDPQRGTVEVKLRVAEPPPYLRQDMTVSVDIEVERHAGALAVPSSAVHELAGPAPWVLAVQGGRTVKRPVKVGLRGEGSVEIVEGLAEGELVLLGGDSQVKAGRRVRLPPP